MKTIKGSQVDPNYTALNGRKGGYYSLYKSPAVSWFVRFFGLKHSWAWAMKKMRQGFMVRSAETVGSLKIRFSSDNNFRLQSNYSNKEVAASWENANFFYGDTRDVSWEIFEWDMLEDPEKVKILKNYPSNLYFHVKKKWLKNVKSKL